MKNKLVEDWLIKAENDLETSKWIMKKDKPITDTAAFHCQQCVEKSLKAFLEFEKQSFKKNHNLTMLINSCSSVNSIFKTYDGEVSELIYYAINIRYPDDFFMPSIDDVKFAIKTASNIFLLVNNLIKGEKYLI